MPSENNLRLQDTDAEEAILGLMMIRGTELADIVMERLAEEDFTMPENRMVFAAIKEMLVEGQTKFDELTIGQRLIEKKQFQDVGGKVRLVNLQSKVPYPVPNRDEVSSYISILKDKTLRRNMFTAGAELQKAAHSMDVRPFDGISTAEKTLMDLSNSSDSKVLDTATVMQDALEYIMGLYNGKPPEGSIKTGIKGLDDILTAIHPADFVIIGARPSMGKTAFATNIMENVALKQGKYVVLYSLEMSGQQIGARMIFSQSGISSEQVRRGELGEGEFTMLEEAMESLKKAPILIDDRAPLDMANIIARTRKLKAEKNLGLVIIDYLQLMTGARGTDGRQQEVSDISRSLKLLAKELNVPIIALSQLNRSLEMRNDKRPQMSDLRESGSLEQDADIILFLYRDDYYHPDTEEQNITEAIVAKHRNGKLGTAKMYFSKDTTHFFDLSPDETSSENAPQKEKVGKIEEQQPLLTEEFVEESPVISEETSESEPPETDEQFVEEEPPTADDEDEGVYF